MALYLLIAAAFAAPAVDTTWPSPPANENLSAPMSYQEYAQQITPSDHTFVHPNANLDKRDWAGQVDSTTASNFALMMQYATAAYCPSTTNTKTWKCGVRCGGSTSNTVITASHENYATGAAGYVGYNNDQQAIIVAVRGTSNVQSAVQDIELWQTAVNMGGFANSNAPSTATIHQGFKNTYMDLQPTIQSAVAALVHKYPSYNILFSGHSLGGAVVSLAAMDTYNNLGDAVADKISVFTFGEPRVGNLDFAKYIDSLPFSSRIFRVAKSGDLVPHIPPKNFFGFTHHVDNYEISRFSTTTNYCVTSGPGGESDTCGSDITLLNVVDHITGYYGWWTYPWVC
ncbi:hypothetical protein HDV01_005648 [Terramyces sp. JEL0728]|nr:hypothetical protein HDV01_005648 [Terramyces sp. JEL0728]